MTTLKTVDRPCSETHAKFLESGFVFENLKGLCNDHALQSFQQYWERLPRDEYLPDQFGVRLRRHGRFRYKSASQRFVALPPEPYFQSENINPLMGGMQRTFKPLEVAANQAEILAAILDRGANLFRLEEWPSWIVNTHFVRIPATEDKAGCPCPEGVHNDGFEYISIHLIGRQNICGGATTLFNNQKTPVADLELVDPLDSIFADDRRILHYTSDFKAGSRDLGYRDTLLVSYERE